MIVRQPIKEETKRESIENIGGVVYGLISSERLIKCDTLTLELLKDVSMIITDENLDFEFFTHILKERVKINE